MFAQLRHIPLREAPWPGGSVAGSLWETSLDVVRNSSGRMVHRFGEFPKPTSVLHLLTSCMSLAAWSPT